MEKTECIQNTFPGLLLSQPVLRGLQTAGFVKPSPAQLVAIPPAKLGTDLIVQTRSGTDRTSVYVVTALEMLKPHIQLQGLQALVLGPTLEVVMQGANMAMKVDFLPFMWEVFIYFMNFFFIPTDFQDT